MQTVDRSGYRLWCRGTLLEFHNGVGVVAPERDCMAADAALDNGERVALTVGGRIVSYLEPREDGVHEVEAAKALREEGS